MTPFCSENGGGSHLSRIDVEDSTCIVTLVGSPEGTGLIIACKKIVIVRYLIQR